VLVGYAGTGAYRILLSDSTVVTRSSVQFRETEAAGQVQLPATQPVRLPTAMSAPAAHQPAPPLLLPQPALAPPALSKEAPSPPRAGPAITDMGGGSNDEGGSEASFASVPGGSQPASQQASPQAVITRVGAFAAQPTGSVGARAAEPVGAVIL
jgi:hypothetical protein